MGGRIAFIFIAIIVLGVMLYIYNSGIVGKGINFIETLAPTSSLSGVSGTPAPSSGSSGTGSSGGTVIAPPPSTPTSSINPADIPAGFTASELSPYFHQVRFGGVSPDYGFYNGSYGQITLYAYLATQSSTIDITRWQIKANHGGEYIPQAVSVYDPSGLAAPSDIILKSGDYVNLYSTSAPVNLRLNECIGYLPNKMQFNPQLPQTCPYIDRSAAQSFSGACQNYIMSLGNCQLPDMSDPRIPVNDYACRSYLLNNFSYHACFDAHRADANFLSNEVRVWMGSSPLDQYHDRVLLLDAKGLLVDMYTY